MEYDCTASDTLNICKSGFGRKNQAFLVKKNNLIQGWHLHMYKSLFIKCYEKSILLTNILKINCKDFKNALNFLVFEN